jgi:hypothetical protein
MDRPFEAHISYDIRNMSAPFSLRVHKRALVVEVEDNKIAVRVIDENGDVSPRDTFEEAYMWLIDPLGRQLPQIRIPGTPI